MAENCDNDCSSCRENCERRDVNAKRPPNEFSDIKKVIGVVSGKGGVGKSMTCALMAVAAQDSGAVTAIMDADITGPSIPKMFGCTGRVMGNDKGILPAISEGGIQMISMNNLLESESEPVIWRGSLISGTVLQFWTDVIWTGVDVMFIDMPPGTGDVPLTVFQSIPVDGIVVVSTPQDLVGMIVQKAVKMAEMMNVPILGLVENMSYIECPDCGKKIELFGESKAERIAKEYSIPVVAKLPVDSALADAADRGKIEGFEKNYLKDFFDQIYASLQKGDAKG